MTVSQATLDQIALTRQEYELIVRKLGRIPTPVELGLFGALWSEHCGYKHSKPLLRGFPTTGAAVRVEAGQENAGVVQIGDGLSVVFKVESHNHPSAIEPFQGAATGVGGIVRDILAMGARPIALLNSLRFGNLVDPRNRFLFHGVVAGISAYGNCIGVPDVGGEVQFDDTYSGNPLVNAMCIGLLKDDSLMSASAKTPGNTLMIVGSSTGRDGIHGASGLASRTFEEQREMRPTVQVGDPFLEKVLIEASLEAVNSGHLEGLQDMGAAGITSAVMECADRGGTGVEIDVDRVPRREPGMSAYEVMLSESQERMLLIVKQGHEEQVRELFSRWDLDVAEFGKVIEDPVGRVLDAGETVAEVPIEILVDAPQYTPQAIRPEYLKGLHGARLPEEPDICNASAILRKLLAAPNIASKRSVYEQYDHEVQTNTAIKPGQGDAAVLRVRETNRGIAVSIDGNGRKAYLEPYVGGALAVVESCRNVACTGGQPLAVTDCLNFGNPEKPEVYYQLKEVIRGMSDACRALGVPVVSGNVSLYNESYGEAIYPTPIVGAVGILTNINDRVSAGFKNPGDMVLALVGTTDVHSGALAGSEYLSTIHGVVSGQPSVDLAAEARLQQLLVKLAKLRLMKSAHDCSDGGLLVTLAECAIIGGFGFYGDWPEDSSRWDSSWFGELSSTVVITCETGNLESIASLSSDANISLIELGTVHPQRLIIGSLNLDEPVAELASVYHGAIEAQAEG